MITLICASQQVPALTMTLVWDCSQGYECGGEQACYALTDKPPRGESGYPTNCLKSNQITQTMKITFETGDFVSVEDNVDAGELAACHVELIKKISPTEWIAENIDFGFGPEGRHIVNEKYLQP